MSEITFHCNNISGCAFCKVPSTVNIASMNTSHDGTRILYWLHAVPVRVRFILLRAMKKGDLSQRIKRVTGRAAKPGLYWD